jgi:hypothetical protein
MEKSVLHYFTNRHFLLYKRAQRDLWDIPEDGLGRCQKGSSREERLVQKLKGKTDSKAESGGFQSTDQHNTKTVFKC